MTVRISKITMSINGRHFSAEGDAEEVLAKFNAFLDETTGSTAPECLSDRPNCRVRGSHVHDGKNVVRCATDAGGAR